MNYKDMSNEELLEIIKKATQELNSRKSQKIIYITDFTRGNSGYKRWAKELIKVDTSKTNGYALVGEWLNSNNDTENSVTKGAYIVECIKDTYKLYKAIDNKRKELIIVSDKTELISFINKCNTIISNIRDDIIDELKD